VLTDHTSTTRPYLDPHGYRELVNNHEAGIGNNMNEITRLITLELVQRLLIKGSYERTASSVAASDSRPQTAQGASVA